MTAAVERWQRHAASLDFTEPVPAESWELLNRDGDLVKPFLLRVNGTLTSIPKGTTIEFGKLYGRQVVRMSMFVDDVNIGFEHADDPDMRLSYPGKLAALLESDLVLGGDVRPAVDFRDLNR